MATFTPLDPDYAARVRGSFARQAVMAFIGAELADVRPGYCEIRLRHRPELTQQHGYVHGGIVGTIGDSAGGYAAFTLMPADAAVLTVEYKLTILKPGRGSLLANAKIIRPGRTLTVARGEVYADDGSHVATMLQTLMALPGRPDTPE